MAVLIESCERTKSGKAWRVKASGQYYNAFLDSGIENHVGKYIEAEIHTHEKYGSSIAAFRVVNSPNAAPQVPPPSQGPVPPAPAPAVAAPKYAEPAKPGTVTPFWLPMASNVVAHAIAAGILKEPNQVASWVRAVQLAMENASDDDIPF